MRYVTAKSILGNFNNVNLYRGCTHGCIYCDSRSDCYQVGDFEDIGVKKDAIAIFENEISRKRNRIMVTTGSMCDPYLPLEKELQLTRKMLQIIRDQYCGVSILTKSDLVLRDLDLIQTINERFGALVCMTITTFDDELCSKIERNVIPTSQRFVCLEKFAEAGIPTGIWMGPILPFINDDEANILAIVRRCVEIGIRYIVVFDFGTTKRRGSEEYFYSCLDEYFPGLKAKYIKTYGNEYICSSPNQLRLWRVFKEACAQNGIIYDLGEIRKIFEKPSQNQQLSLF